MNEFQSSTFDQAASAQDEGLRSFMLQVYREMATSLTVSGLVAYVFGHDLNFILSGAGGATILPAALVSALFQGPLIFVVMFAPLIMIFFMGKAMSGTPRGARQYLYGFAALYGVGLGTIFVQYTGLMIAQAFLVTAGAFAALSLWGYSTKRDISGWGSFLFMGLVGLILASIMNIFMQSDGINFAVTLIGVLIFAAYTAHDTQKLKTDYLQWRAHLNEDEIARAGTAGALNLFIDFMLLFQYLLEIMNALSDD